MTNYIRSADMKKSIKALFIALLCPFVATAANPEWFDVRNELPKTGCVRTDSIKIPRKKVPTQFVWGADAGASIDMTGDDMSTVDVSASFGLRHGWINFLGVGAEANFMVSNSCRSYPIFLQFRTSFAYRPKILFWELKGGMSLNYLEHNHRQSGAYASTGLGAYLARGEKFRSYIVLAYTFRERRRIERELVHPFHDLHYAGVRIGVSF